MKKIINILIILASFQAFASGDDLELQHADIDLTDRLSLQRGAKNFVTYCLGCHSIKHMRYKRIALDFNIDEKEVLKEITPYGANIYDQMVSAMNKHDSTKWFGIDPPDLSLIARSRGADWLFSYLKGFYLDPDKPLGVNNTVFEDVGMPNVLWQLQGEQVALIKKIDGQEVVTELELRHPGQLSPDEFDDFVNDLVNFLVYAAEPMQLERKRMGKYVLFFILMFTIVAFLLKREYWKDVH